MSDAQNCRHSVTWDDLYEKMRVTCWAPGKYYGVPKGGLIALLWFKTAFQYVSEHIQFEPDPTQADFILDDILDSGRTMARHRKYNKPFLAIYDKVDKQYAGKWIEFPWERDERPAQDAVVRIIEAVGEDPSREGLLETPERVVKSWAKLYGGYKENPDDILSKTFTERSDEMVMLRNIELYSTCEHHLLPFFGRCHIAYIPKDKVVGISKLARLVECYARRMQIQERLTNQIAEAINMCLAPVGVGVIIEAQHFCMTSRGVEKQNSVMVTSAMLGLFREDNKARDEFLKLKTGN